MSFGYFVAIIVGWGGGVFVGGKGLLAEWPGIEVSKMGEFLWLGFGVCGEGSAWMGLFVWELCPISLAHVQDDIV